MFRKYSASVPQVVPPGRYPLSTFCNIFSNKSWCFGANRRGHAIKNLENSKLRLNQNLISFGILGGPIWNAIVGGTLHKERKNYGSQFGHSFDQLWHLWVLGEEFQLKSMHIYTVRYGKLVVWANIDLVNSLRISRGIHCKSYINLCTSTHSQGQNDPIGADNLHRTAGKKGNAWSESSGIPW